MAVQSCNTSEELELLAHNFTATVSHFGKVVTVELGQGGVERTVTLENREEFVHKLYNWMLVDCISDQLKSLRKGLNFLISGDILTDFTPYELELALSGQRVIDVHYLQENAAYEDYTKHSQQVRWLWKVLEEFSQAERSKFLQFTTGCGCVPVGVQGWRIKIQMGAADGKSQCGLISGVDLYRLKEGVAFWGEFHCIIQYIE